MAKLSMYQNAVQSLEMGIKDFLAEDDGRVLSAIRNLYSGVLLLMKERLHRLSPALIRQRVLPKEGPNGLEWVGTGKNTADFGTLQERWSSLGWEMNWSAMNRLQGIRNDVEHHEPRNSGHEMREAIAQVFAIVVRLFQQLGEEPAQVLEPEVWQEMLAENHVFRELEDECKLSRETLSGDGGPGAEALVDHAECPTCKSPLLKARATDVWPQAALTCVACGEESDLLAILPAALRAYFGTVETCPNCGEEAFVERDYVPCDENVCTACGEGLPQKECMRCFEPLTVRDQNNDGYCDYCQHVWDKMMAE